MLAEDDDISNKPSTASRRVDSQLETRRSSFAKDFFQSGEGLFANSLDGTAGAEQPPPAAPAAPAASPVLLPDSPRGRSARRMSRVRRKPAPQQQQPSESPSPKQPAALNVNGDGPSNRRFSWYQDALAMASKEDLAKMLGVTRLDDLLGNSSASENDDDRLSDNEDPMEEEIRSQFKIIAHNDARQRLEENLGQPLSQHLDMKYGKKSSKGSRKSTRRLNAKRNGSRSRSDDDDDDDDDSLFDVPTPSMYVPPLARRDNIGTRGGVQKPAHLSEHVPSPYKVGECALLRELHSRESQPTPTELRQGCPSTTVLESTLSNGKRPKQPQQHDGLASLTTTTRCLGCQQHLRVERLATLVHCVHCKTIGPASSTAHY